MDTANLAFRIVLYWCGENDKISNKYIVIHLMENGTDLR